MCSNYGIVSANLNHVTLMSLLGGLGSLVIGRFECDDGVGTVKA